MAAGGVHHLQEDAPLAREANAAGAQLAFEMAGEFVIDAFAGGDAMCGGGGHGCGEIIAKAATAKRITAEKQRAQRKATAKIRRLAFPGRATTHSQEWLCHEN